MPLQYDHGRIPVEDGAVANRSLLLTLSKLKAESHVGTWQCSSNNPGLGK